MSTQYAKNIIKAKWNYHSKKLTCSNYPLAQGIEVTNACNLNCPMCERESVKARGIGYIDRFTFRRVVNFDNAPMLRHIRLFGHGEPLMHKDIVHFVRESRIYAKSVGFTTNATLLTPRLSDELLDAGLTTICFSFEGTNKEVYESIRRGADYERTRDNIFEFLKRNGERGSPCYTSMAIVDLDETHEDLGTFLKVWEPIIQNVKVLPRHDWGLKGHRQDMCFWAWFGFFIWWNGDVSPCCVNERNFMLGNVNDKTLLEIWNAEEYQEFRENMLNGSICKTCTLAKDTFVDSYCYVGNPNRLRFFRDALRFII